VRVERRAHGVGVTAAPHGTLISCTVVPYAWQILVQRSPNLPPLTTIASSPADNRLVTALSIAPVPDAARMSTSSLVPNSSRSPVCTSASTALNCGVRW
jgi:hypothetical protein